MCKSSVEKEDVDYYTKKLSTWIEEQHKGIEWKEAKSISAMMQRWRR